MDRRHELQDILEELLGSDQVYFQSPGNRSMTYPAIVYSRTNGKTEHGDNMGYAYSQGYEVIYMDRSPDNAFVPKMVAREKCSYNRSYISDGLHHDVFTLFH